MKKIIMNEVYWYKGEFNGLMCQVVPLREEPDEYGFMLVESPFGTHRVPKDKLIKVQDTTSTIAIKQDIK